MFGVQKIEEVRVGEVFRGTSSRLLLLGIQNQGEGARVGSWISLRVRDHFIIGLVMVQNSGPKVLCSHPSDEVTPRTLIYYTESSNLISHTSYLSL